MTKTIWILAIAAAFVAGSIATGTLAFAGGVDEDDDDEAQPRLLATSTGLNQPLGVAVDSSGNVYVVERQPSPGRVKQFTSDLSSSTVFVAGLLDARAVAVDSSGNVYVGEDGAGKVQKRNSAGTLLATATGLSFPFDFAVDSSGNVYVTEEPANKITKFTSFPSTKSPFVTGLTDPTGVAVDSSGNVYVTEVSIGTVKKFNSAGTLLATTTGLSFPIDIAVDDTSGNVYVVELNAGRVTQFTCDLSSSTDFVTGLNTPLPLLLTRTYVGGDLRSATSFPVQGSYSLLEVHCFFTLYAGSVRGLLATIFDAIFFWYLNIIILGF